MSISRRESARLCLCIVSVSLLAATAGMAQRSRSSSAGGGSDDRTLILERQLLEETSKAELGYVKELGRVVAWAASRGLKEDGGRILEKMKALRPEYTAIARLQERLEKAEAAAADDLERLQKTLQRRLESAGGSHARRLFTLAAACMKYGLFSRAYELVKATLEADPDHRQARSALSYTYDREAKTWITKWESQMRRTHYVTSEGWVAKKDRKKWDEGLRPYKGKWVTKEEEARIRGRSNYAPYSVETEHFEVRSNLGREKAFEFAQRLEDFYGVFFEFFVGFWDQVKGAKLLFNTPDVKKRHVVNLFPSRVDYLDYVRAEKGNDELLVRSGGFWSGGDNCSFFFWTEDPQRTNDVLYHETTHQLLGETKDRGGLSRGNVWVVEGIAVYMELWRKVDGVWRPGYEIDAMSLKTVQKFLEAQPGWSLASFLALDHKAFHDKANRTLHYFLGGALSHFLLHYQAGIYREDYIQLLRAYYEGKLREDSLPEYIRVEGAASSQEALATLDKQFREYMKNLKRPGEVQAEESDLEPDEELETASS